MGNEGCNTGNASSCSFVRNERERSLCRLPNPVCKKAFFQLRDWITFSTAAIRILRKESVETSPDVELTRASSYAPTKNRLYNEKTCVSRGCRSEVIEAGTYIRYIECRVHACTTFLERCIFAASSINTNRHVLAKGLSASPNTLIRFTTTSLRSQALLRRRTKMLSVLPFMRMGVIHACITCSAPTMTCGSALFTSSWSLKNAASVTALLLNFNGFRLSICKNCRLVKPDGNATKPRLSCGDNLQQDSSMFIRTTVLSPTPSDSRKLCHLQVANACTETRFHRSSNNNSGENGSQKKARKTGSLYVYAHTKVKVLGPFFGLLFGTTFSTTCHRQVSIMFDLEPSPATFPEAGARHP